jgi:chemotaxis protein methyltransferase CheR
MSEIGSREFDFSDDNFHRIRQFVGEHTGIVLSDAKKNMVYGRLSKRIRKGGFADFTAFCDAIDNGDEHEQEFLINAITTNLTAFFRENHHFEFLANTVIPELVKEKGHNKRLRIWSAGCSTGEEPYSIAITLKESLPNFDQWDVKILATDLDANVVEHGKQGIYRAERIEDLSPERTKRWFHRGSGDNADMVKVKDELKEMIRFKRLNLLNQWPMKGPFDLMFCRNVVIYFDKPTQKVLFARYEKILKPKAYLFIGHSESLYKVTTDFESLKHTTYRKKA